MTEPAPDYLRELYIVDNFVDRDLTILLEPSSNKPFRHLVLTGRNGCGKSSTLRGLQTIHRQSTANGRHIAMRVWTSTSHRLPMGDSQYASPICCDRRALSDEGIAIRIIQAFSARRTTRFYAPKGPTRNVALDGASGIEQMLVNWETRAALATTAGEDAEAAGFRARLDDFQTRLRALLHPLPITLEFSRSEFRYRVRHTSGVVDLEHLPDGAKAALSLWLDTWAAVEQIQAVEGPEGGGLVLIDEPESHLHLGLQERLLPFLADSFPTVQFVVATHSPAIAASLDNALVYDLTTRKGWKSEDFHAWRYGRVMTDVFGLDDEYSAAVTTELHRLEELRDKPARTSAEDDELRALAHRLRDSSHAMVLDLVAAAAPP